MNVDWYHGDLWAAVENAEITYIHFDDYFTSLVNFLDEKHKFYEKEIEEAWNIKIDQIEDNNVSGMPGWMQEVYWPLENFDEFENLLLSSFFISIQSYLETELIKHCCRLSDANKEKKKQWKKCRIGCLEQAMKYLTGTQKIEFDYKKSCEWQKIELFQKVRNCIVHYRGELEDYDHYQDLLEYAQQKDSKLKIKDMRCIISREFCADALKTIEVFLNLIAKAKIADEIVQAKGKE